MNIFFKISVVFLIAAFLSACGGTRSEYAESEIENAINRNDPALLQSLLSLEGPGYKTVTEELIEKVRGSFVSLSIEGFGLLAPFTSNETKHLASLGLGSPIAEAFGLRVKGDNGTDGEVHIKYCDEKSKNPCVIEFRIDAE